MNHHHTSTSLEGVAENGQQPRDRTYILEATLFASLVLGPAITASVTMDREGGSLAEWVAAIATVAAFIAAVFAGRYAAAAFRLERTREDDRIRERTREQASQVAAWFGKADIDVTQGLIDQSESTRRVQRAIGWRAPAPVDGIYLRNASDLPVTAVVVRVSLDGLPGRGPIQSVGILPPADSPKFVELADPNGMAWDIANRGVAEVNVDLSFRDSAGIHWVRSSSGDLTQGRITQTALSSS